MSEAEKTKRTRAPNKIQRTRLPKRFADKFLKRIVEEANPKSYLSDRTKVRTLLLSAYLHLSQRVASDRAGISIALLEKWLKQYKDHIQDPKRNKCQKAVKIFGEGWYYLQNDLYARASDVIRNAVDEGDSKIALEIARAGNPEGMGRNPEQQQVNIYHGSVLIQQAQQIENMSERDKMERLKELQAKHQKVLAGPEIPAEAEIVNDTG